MGGRRRRATSCHAMPCHSQPLGLPPHTPHTLHYWPAGCWRQYWLRRRLRHGWLAATYTHITHTPPRHIHSWLHGHYYAAHCTATCHIHGHTQPHMVTQLSLAAHTLLAAATYAMPWLLRRQGCCCSCRRCRCHTATPRLLLAGCRLSRQPIHTCRHTHAASQPRQPPPLSFEGCHAAAKAAAAAATATPALRWLATPLLLLRYATGWGHAAMPYATLRTRHCLNLYGLRPIPAGRDD